MWASDDFDEGDGVNDDVDLASALTVVALDAREEGIVDVLLSPPRANAAAAEVIKWRRKTRKEKRKGRRWNEEEEEKKKGE